MRKKKFIIAGASTYAVKNHGDDAMLANLVQNLRNKYPSCEIVLIARHPSDKIKKILNIKAIKNFDHDKKPKNKDKFFFGFNRNDDTEHLKEVAKEIASSDLLILGGNLFMEIFPNNFLRGVSSYTSLISIISKTFSTPIVLYGVNLVNKVCSKITKEHVRFILENSKKITVREKSAKKLLQRLNFSSPEIAVYGDPAFGVRFSKEKSFAINTLRKKKIYLPNNKKIVGLCVREEYWKINKTSQMKKIKNLSKVLDNFQKKTNCIFLFIPNCTYSGVNKWQDDRFVHKQIKKNMKKKSSCILINKELNLFETMNIFSLLEMHITNRRHSTCFAALNSVPSVVIKDLSGNMANHQSSMAKEIGLSQNMIDLNKSVSFLSAKILKNWKNRKIDRKKINKNIKKLISISRKQINYLTKDI